MGDDKYREMARDLPKAMVKKYSWMLILRLVLLSYLSTNPRLLQHHILSYMGSQGVGRVVCFSDGI
jgi:hypothetical protein